MLVPTVLGALSTTTTALADNGGQQRPASAATTNQQSNVDQSSSASQASNATSISLDSSSNQSSSDKASSNNDKGSNGFQASHSSNTKANSSNSSLVHFGSNSDSIHNSSNSDIHNTEKNDKDQNKKQGKLTVQFKYHGKVIATENLNGQVSSPVDLINNLPANLKVKFGLAPNAKISNGKYKLLNKNGTLSVVLVHKANKASSSASSRSKASSASSSASANSSSKASSASSSANSSDNNKKNKKATNTNAQVAKNINNSLKKNYAQTQRDRQAHIVAQRAHNAHLQHARYKAYQEGAQRAEHDFEEKTARTRSEMMPVLHRYATPLPSRKYTMHRSHVSNPMFRTNNVYRHYAHEYSHNGGHYRNTVPMSKSTEPTRDMSKVKPFKGFDKNVLRYKPYLDKVCQHYHMTKYETLFLAIMENESRGQGRDVMQSSESAGLHTNSLNPQQSIEQAVKYMKSIVSKASKMDRAERRNKKMKPADYHDYSTDTALLAQTYNYGAGFLDYVSKSKNGYNLNVAQQYSKDVVAPRLGNKNGSKYKYDNPIARMYHKTFLYTNGGNYFYGPMVEQYMTNGTFMHQILQHLIKYAGQKYVFGGKNPHEGFDCSGIVSYGLKLLHVDFPSYTVTQWHDTKPVKSINDAKPGDLIFFKGTYGSPNFISHVEIVVDRDTMFGSDGSGVGFHDIHQPYWNKHFAGIRRLPQANELNKKARMSLEKEVKSAVNEYHK